MSPKAQLWTQSVPELQVIAGGVMLCGGSGGIYSFLVLTGDHSAETRNNRAAG